MEQRLWMVCYDIADDRKRRRVERGLQALGERIQYSVFECRMTMPEARFYLARLAEELDQQTDSLRAYPLCVWCAARVDGCGTGLPASVDMSEDRVVVL